MVGRMQLAVLVELSEDGSVVLSNREVGCVVLGFLDLSIKTLEILESEF